MFDRALAVADGIGDGELKASALASLANPLEPQRRESLLARAVAAAEGIGNDYNKKARALVS